MSRELRPIRADEMQAYGDQIGLVFSGARASAEWIESLHELVELDRTLAWFEGGRMVASAGVCSFRMAVPGGARLGCADLTRVTVLPTHRRQGLLTGMMRAHLDDARSRGEPLAALYASETVIYGRYGYGIGTVHAKLETELEDGVWLRLVDIAGALAGRAYSADGTIAIEVADEFCEWNRGTWTLEAGAGGARCERGGRAELALSVADLATVYLGDSSFRDLLWAGRLEERRPGAARRADSMFASPVVPWCPFHF